MNRSEMAYLEIILGPMFSGKTSKLLQIHKQCKICNIQFSLNVEYCLIPTTELWDNICIHCLQEKRETHICNCQICKDLKKELIIELK